MDQSNTRSSPLVSIIIPTYNRRALLPQAVASALEQTLSDIEVIIVDDGSTDGTQELFSAAADPRIRYCQAPHRGACAARNLGLEMAEGKYIAFLDSDDRWYPDKLAIQQRQLEQSGADVVFCAFHRHDSTEEAPVRYPEADQPEGRIDYRRLLCGNIVSTQTLFGRAEWMKAVRFDERFPRMQDWEYAIRLAQVCDLRYFSDVLVDVYIQADSISRKPELGLEALRLLYQKYQQDFEASMPATLLVLSAIHGFARQCGKTCARDYWRALSGRRSFKDSLCLLKAGVRLALQGIWGN